ncbi:MAG: hypothetical protein DWP97_08700 [Calditrichaeota bacterium]|nr:MAG: hypothetical protein DWP97_08700 [Calditrichota bacterium]
MAMKSNCESKPLTKRQLLIHILDMAIAFTVSIYLTNQGHPIIGWFFFGLILGIGNLYAYKKPGERWNIVNIIFILVIALITTSLFNLLKMG